MKHVLVENHLVLMCSPIVNGFLSYRNLTMPILPNHAILNDFNYIMKNSILFSVTGHLQVSTKGRVQQQHV